MYLENSGGWKCVYVYMKIILKIIVVAVNTWLVMRKIWSQEEKKHPEALHPTPGNTGCSNNISASR